MKRAYIITDFDLKTDVSMKYPLKYRCVHYSKESLYDDIRYILESIHEEYQEITNTLISFNDFYDKFKVTLKVSAISLNHKKITTEEEYNKYLEDVKNINKEELCDYLLDFTDVCEFYYDHNLNLKETYTQITNEFNIQTMYGQQAFSYKALFPEKYHVDKYKDGDRVLYDDKEYIIWKYPNKENSIYESDNPLNYILGYTLINEDGYILNDDKWCYFPVDEDLELLPEKIKVISKEQIDSIRWYICFQYNENIHTIDNTNRLSDEILYDKLIRSDSHITVVLKMKNNDDITITNDISYNLYSYTFCYNGEPVAYVIGYIHITEDCDIDKIIVKYDGNKIDEINVNKHYTKNSAINILKILE